MPSPSNSRGRCEVMRAVSVALALRISIDHGEDGLAQGVRDCPRARVVRHVLEKRADGPYVVRAEVGQVVRGGLAEVGGPADPGVVYAVSQQQSGDRGGGVQRAGQAVGRRPPRTTRARCRQDPGDTAVWPGDRLHKARLTPLDASPNQ
jgi:hypothetical protein